jgi:hypothetical protein
MRSFLRLLFSAVVALATIVGCASNKVPKVVFHAGDEVPPDFLSGPAALLLTNLDGFSATIAFSQSSPGALPQTGSGDLIERDGRLIYQPAGMNRKKKTLIEGGMIFIWNGSLHGGYVLSDPLQAYAGIPATIQGTNVVWKTEGAVEEEANGHPCRRLQAVVDCDDGTSAHFTVWEAEDAKRLPVRIRSDAGSRQLTVNLSNVRLELPAPELFTPPDGFTKYPTAVALMNEMIVRQTELVKANGPGNNNADGPAPPINNWRVGQPSY